MVGRSIGQKKRTLERVWVPEKARLLSKKAWLQSQLEGVIFSTNVYTAFNMFKKRSMDVN